MKPSNNNSANLQYQPGNWQMWYELRHGHSYAIINPAEPTQLCNKRGTRPTSPPSATVETYYSLIHQLPYSW